RHAGGLGVRPVVAIVQHAPGRAVDIVVLAVSDRPEKSDQPHPAEKQRDGNEVEQRIHAASASGVCGASAVLRRLKAGGAPRSRSEFATTTIEDVDMAMAAISGVA